MTRADRSISEIAPPKKKVGRFWCARGNRAENAHTGGEGEETPPRNLENHTMYKTLATLALGGIIAVGAYGFAHVAQADDGGLSQSIVAQAEAIGEDIEVECETPRREAALAATADPYALDDLAAAEQRCNEIGIQYGYFVDIVEQHADAVTASIPEEAREAAEAAMAAATPAVKAQVEAGDAEGAVRTLFESIAPQFDIESEVGE